MERLWLRDRLVLPDLNVIVADGKNVHVEPKTMEVLLEFANHPGEVISKTHLLRSVWNGVFVCEDVVTNAVSLLRRALGDETKTANLIQTIPKRGYRLVAQIRRESPESSKPDLGSQMNDLRQSILRARHLRHEETVPSLNSACAYCEEIIRQEPNCATAHAELALALFLLEKLGAVRREEVEPRIRTAVDCARRLDECASMTLLCLAKQEYRYDWQWDSAERNFRAAMSADPHDPDVFVESSIMLSVMRRFDESLSCAQRACQLDSISPAARLQAGHANYASGRWAAAASHYQRLLRFTPQHVFARWGLADSLTRLGMAGNAIAVLSEGLAVPVSGRNPLLLTSLSRIEAMIKTSGGTAPVFNELHLQTNDPVLLAELYGSIGELTKAFHFLEQAADRRHYRLSAVNMFPQFEPIRQEPRYRRLLQRIGLDG